MADDAEATQTISVVLFDSAACIRRSQSERDNEGLSRL